MSLNLSTEASTVGMADDGTPIAYTLVVNSDHLGVRDHWCKLFLYNITITMNVSPDMRTAASWEVTPNYVRIAKVDRNGNMNRITIEDDMLEIMTESDMALVKVFKRMTLAEKVLIIGIFTTLDELETESGEIST
jgi:hypothetical protein